MPIGPKRRDSFDSMMQYTYLPRLAVTPLSTALSTERGSALSPLRRSGRLTARGAGRARVPPFGRGAGLADRGTGFFWPDLGGAALRSRAPRPLLPDAFRIFPLRRGFLLVVVSRMRRISF